MTAFNVMSSEEDLANLFSNLIIEDYGEGDYQIENKNKVYYNQIVEYITKLLKINESLKMNIIDNNIVIVDNILFGINTHFNHEDAFSYRPILHLPAFNNSQIPQKYDPLWWNDGCAEFANSMAHLRNSSYNKLSINTDSVIKQSNLIDIEIIKLVINIMRNEFDGIDLNLIQMYVIALYLEHFFYSNNLESFYNAKLLDDNIYFKKYKMLTLDYLRNHDKKFHINLHFYKKNINKALLTILTGSKNILILFGPYGYDSLYENLEFIELDLKAIIGFNQTALKYFALNNLVEMKLFKKYLHISNLNDYVKLICEGAKLIE